MKRRRKAQYLNVSVERCQGIEEVERAIPAICDAILEYSKNCGVPIPKRPPVETAPGRFRYAWGGAFPY